MGSLLVCFFYYSLGLENSSAYCKVSCYSAFKCGERRFPKSYKTIGGCPTYDLQIGVPILPWMMNMRNREWKKQQTTWQVSFPLWISEVKRQILKNMCNWQQRKLLMESTSGRVGGLSMGYKNPFGFKFEYIANGGEWCGWPSNTSSWASSSPRVCPILLSNRSVLHRSRL